MPIFFISMIFWPILFPIVAARVITYFASIPITLIFCFYTAQRLIEDKNMYEYFGAGFLASVGTFLFWLIGHMLDNREVNEEIAYALKMQEEANKGGEWLLEI